jgi:diguanylate cyclase (GGDEF)-like protein
MDEQNRYVRLPFSYAYYVVDLFYLLFGIYILEKYQEKYGKVRFFPIFLMMGPVVMGCILQVFFYGISLIWVSLAVGMTSIYMSLQNEFSYQDKLTGLYNRAYLDYCLESALKGKGKGLGGIMIDVDYFKKINDTYGHSAGDEALVDVTRIINFSKPDKAIATRFAGDEFILLVKDTSDDEMKRIIKNIHDEVDLFNETEGREYKLSLSTGYAIYDPKSESLDDFLKHMDDNMYEEKNLKHGK